jgi:lipopolysaccharide/colanic/teichoic acid biosynthesis glycosyltransferase
MKRLLDIVLSLLVVAILLPVFVVIAVAIKLSSKGPVIFRQERVDKNGRPFIFYKFRTMKTEVDPFGPGMPSAVRGVSLKNKSFVAST